MLATIDRSTIGMIKSVLNGDACWIGNGPSLEIAKTGHEIKAKWVALAERQGLSYLTGLELWVATLLQADGERVRQGSRFSWQYGKAITKIADCGRPTMAHANVNIGTDSETSARRAAVRRVCALGLALCAMVLPCSGCRMLQGDTGNKSLVTARQLSLRGADALQRSRTQDAELLFSQALAISPVDERAQWGYAMTLWQRGERQKATQHMSEALRLSGRNPEYAIQLGEMYEELGDYEAAKKIALDVLSGNRNHARAWALLGDTHRSAGEWVDALECYHRALLIRSDYPKVQLSIAEIYRKQGRPERALATLDRMVDLHVAVRDDPEHMLFRGLVFADLNRPQEAAALLAGAAERLPTDQLDRHLEILGAQYRMGELVQARITLGRLSPEHAGDQRVQAAKTQLDQSFAAMSRPGATDPDQRSPSEAGGTGERPGMAARTVSGPSIRR